MPNYIMNMNTVIVAVKLAAKYKHSDSLFKYYCKYCKNSTSALLKINIIFTLHA